MGNQNPQRNQTQLITLRELFVLVDQSTWKKTGVWWVVTILTTGLPATIETALQKFSMSSVALGFDGLFAQTAPLLWSVAFVAFACHRGWLEQAGAIPSAALILFGGWLGHIFQHGARVVPVDWLPTDRYALLGSVVFAALNLLIAYVITYGIGACLASVIVGTLLGVAWSKWLFSLQRRYTCLETSASIPTTTDQSERRRAA